MQRTELRWSPAAVVVVLEAVPKKRQEQQQQLLAAVMDTPTAAPLPVKLTMVSLRWDTAVILLCTGSCSPEKAVASAAVSRGAELTLETPMTLTGTASSVLLLDSSASRASNSAWVTALTSVHTVMFWPGPKTLMRLQLFSGPWICRLLSRTVPVFSADMLH